MPKLKLEMETLRVESFEPAEGTPESGTVRGYLTAYYEFCYPGQTNEQTCTCEPTCNAATCYNCASAGCPTAVPWCTRQAACTGTCQPISNLTDCPAC